MSDGNNDMSTYVKYENGENKYIAVDGILNKNSISAISNVVHIEFGKAVTKISANTFNNAGEYKLSSIFFSNYTISSIGLCAFYNCNMLTVYTNNEYVKDYCNENNIPVKPITHTESYKLHIKEGNYI